MTNTVSSEVCIDLPKGVESQTPAPRNQSPLRQGMAASYVVLGIILAIYLVFSIRVLRAEISSTGTLVFPLDDTYIGMAMAKNLVLHGVWGISATRFASATSSPGYVLLLAGLYRITGPTVWGALALSLTFGFLALVMAWRLLARTHWGVQLLALLAIFYFAPLHVIGLLGMEHTLHLLLVLGFLQLVGNDLAQQKSPGWGLMLLTVPRVLTDKRLRGMLDIVFGGIILHLALADVGRASVYRYEAYLIGAAIATIACAVPYLKISRDKWAAAALFILALAGIVLMTQRTVEAAASLPERSKAIYSQQVQMALFMKKYEEGAVVAANDVGAINFFADIDCLDLYGLGDRDVFWLKRKGQYANAALTKLAAARHVKIAVVYDYWFSILTPIGGPPLPLSWIRVERWRTPNGFYLGGDTVSFYAANPAEAVKLKSALDGFAPSLPRDVEVLGP